MQGFMEGLEEHHLGHRQNILHHQLEAPQQDPSAVES